MSCSNVFVYFWIRQNTLYMQCESSARGWTLFSAYYIDLYFNIFVTAEGCEITKLGGSLGKSVKRD